MAKAKNCAKPKGKKKASKIKKSEKQNKKSSITVESMEKIESSFPSITCTKVFPKIPIPINVCGPSLNFQCGFTTIPSKKIDTGKSKSSKTKLTCTVTVITHAIINIDLIDSEPYRHMVGWRLMKVINGENQGYVEFDSITSNELFTQQNIKGNRRIKKTYKLELDSLPNSNENTGYVFLMSAFVWERGSNSDEADIHAHAKVEIEGKCRRLDFVLSSAAGNQTGYWAEDLGYYGKGSKTGKFEFDDGKDCRNGTSIKCKECCKALVEKCQNDNSEKPPENKSSKELIQQRSEKKANGSRRTSASRKTASKKTGQSSKTRSSKRPIADRKRSQRV